MRGTPPWLGFNIELKYPTDAETAAMTTRWYTRNFFIDAILKVLNATLTRGPEPQRLTSLSAAANCE